MERDSEPLLSNRSPKGGLKTLPFIIANEAFERVASFGLSPNMIFYLKTRFNMETTTATNLILFWNAATSMLPVVGAIVADSYVGRYPMIGFGSIASLLGMILLWLTTLFPESTKPTTYQFMLLYASFGFMTIGAGGIRASSMAFGADQVINTGGDNKLQKSGQLQSYFGWYNVFTTGSYIISLSCIVYIQDHLGWTIGFGIPVVLMFLSAILFFLASPFYVKVKPNSNLLIGLVQVVVASYKNRHINISSQSNNDITYHQRNDSNLLIPSDKLRFLNKACIIRNPEQDLTPDGKSTNPWSLCTIDQVEELKALIKVIPIWSTGIIFSVNVSQGTLGALQAKTMDRHITRSFEIPAGSLGFFLILTLTLWIALYDRVIIPVASKIRGKPSHLSTKLRMGIGILFTSLSMASWAIVESIRRQRAINEGFSDEPEAVVDISVMWLLPHLVMDGLAEAFYGVAVNEFFYTELPKTMSSIAVNLMGVGMSVANMAASAILSAVDCVSRIGGKESWVSNNINKGHYDYYFWFLAGLFMVNFIYYLGCSKFYGPCKWELNNVFNGSNSSREED
ncbi:hypothetical protein EZV62_013382 [Acer yangbiense]|uniref:Major facilitator superfamily (MFS) profile domain-containing protein n=1 Tax=Acer yangbiense TaxID=1000413 RepID=A0A5C7HZ98_9ROSI|nr:hypothetical protein EZV62_013382 [Acer yangbiense]